MILLEQWIWPVVKTLPKLLCIARLLPPGAISTSPTTQTALGLRLSQPKKLPVRLFSSSHPILLAFDALSLFRFFYGGLHHFLKRHRPLHSDPEPFE